MEITIHKILKGSCANGPGIRNVVWFQGCTLHCPGCFNPDTHDPTAGTNISVESLCADLLAPTCDGITISGGEPFQQPEALYHLLKALRTNDAPPVLVFSGYPYSTLQTNPVCAKSLSLIDALICGPYHSERPTAYDRFCASDNQELILLSPRYTLEDFENLPLSEIIITQEGETIHSGIHV